MEGTFIDGKYEVVRQLGQGGMGAVYEARHRATGRKVAVKVIVPAALAGGLDIIARFQREARASGSIDSPFVVQVFDAGVDPATGAPYMAMECLSGEDVQQLVGRLGPLPPHVVLRIAAQACHGLHKAHETGIVHRDIKSANLYLAKREGDTNEMITKILDFGIAKVRASPLQSGEDHRLTKTGSMLGSPLYMSPEQAIGAKDLDARSDIFSMGVMMYEALAGSPPNGHLENLGALLMAICSQPATPVQDRAPWVPAEIAAVVHKALATKPEDRYQTADELRAAAIALLPGGGTTIVGDMLVRLTDDAKRHNAPRYAARAISGFDATAAAAPAIPPIPSSSRALSVVAPVNASAAVSADASRPAMHLPMSTTAGLGSDHGVPEPSGVPKPFRWGPVVGGAAAVLALGGGGFYLKAKVVPSASVTAAPIVQAAATSGPAGTSAPPPPAAVATTRTDKVTVSPPEATVQVDGKSAAVSGGQFEVTGTIGSGHDVRVTLAGVETRVVLMLSPDGPLPPRVEATPRPRTMSSQAGTRTPAGASRPVAEPASPAAPPAQPEPAPAAPAVTPKKPAGNESRQM